jgi:hypothetical protein
MKYGIREAVDVVFKATAAMTLGTQTFAKGEPVIYFDSLKSSTTEGGASTVYAQGGKGNSRLIAWEGDKTVTFTFEDALISTTGLAILAGAGLAKASAGEPITVHKTVKVTSTVATAGTVPVNISAAIEGDEDFVATDVFGMIVNANGEIITKLGVASGATASALTFTSTALLAPIGSYTVLVDFYVTKEAGMTSINITPDKFAGYFYIEGDTLFRRQRDGLDLAAQVIIPNAKIQTAFNLSMSPTGDPTTFTFTADAFPGVIKGSTVKTLYALQVEE